MPWLNWAVTTTFVLFQFFLQAASGLMATLWQNDFQLTLTEVGYLSSAFYIAYVVMQIPVGIAYDRFGARKILCAASLLMCLGIFGLGWSHVYWQAFLARILMGSGSAFGFVGMLYVTSSWFSNRHFALLVGVAETLAMLGVALAELAMAWVINHYGWRMMMFIAGSGMLLISLLIIFFIRDKPFVEGRHSVKKLSIFEAIKKIIRYKEIWLAGFYGFAMFAIMNVVITLWGVPFFIQYNSKFSLHTASIMMSLAFLGTAAGTLFNGWFIKRYQHLRQPLMTLFATITALLFAIMLYSSGLSFMTLVLLLFLVGFFSSSYILVFAIVKDKIELPLQATGLATTNMILMASAPLLQPLVGKLLEWHFTFPEALSVVEIMLVLAIAVSFGLRDEPQK